MAGLHLERHRPAARVAAVVVVALCCTALAQTPRPRVDTLPAGPTTSEGALYLVLRTGPKENKESIENRLQLALNKISSEAGKPPPKATIRPVSRSFVEEFEALANRRIEQAPTARTGVAIEPLLTRETRYEIRLAPTQVLKKLRVKYQKADIKEYTPAAKGQLELIASGRYAFTPEADDMPVSYEVDAAELDQDGTIKTSTLKETWPISDKFFVVTIPGFDPNLRTQLEAAIKNADVVGVPFTDVKFAKDLVFAFASLNSAVGITGGDPIADGALTVSVPTISNLSPTRVWVYFPLDDKTAKETLGKFRTLGDAALSKAVRQAAVPAVQAAVLGSGDEPRWYELDPVRIPGEIKASKFERKIKLKDIPGLARSYSKATTLVVWEFDNGMGTRFALPVPAPAGDRLAPGENVYVVEREIAGWSNGIVKAAEKELKPEPKPDDKK